MEISNDIKIKEFDFNSIHRSKIYTEAVDTYFDRRDDMTRNILLAVNEADQNQVLVALSNKLYKHIVDKVDDIDFGTIPESRGDFTKIDNYEELIDCLNIMAQVLEQYHQPTDKIDTISRAINNLTDRKDLFTKAYKLNVEMPIIIYNTIALSIVTGISFMISSCIEFVKLPDGSGFNIAVDKAGMTRTNAALLYADLEKFNSMCDKGDFDKAMDFVIKQNAKNFAGLDIAIAASSVVLVLGSILLIIPIIRELIFIFYYSRVKVSDYFDSMSTLLQMNAYNIENNLTSKDSKERKAIAAKQKQIADQFSKISGKIKVSVKTGEEKASKEVKALDSQKLKHDEVLDRVPDSANSVLF